MSGPPTPPPAPDQARRAALRLLLVSPDLALAQRLRAQRAALGLELLHAADAAAAETLLLQPGRVELLLIDEAIGRVALLALVLQLREDLYKDWLPLLVLGGSAELLQLLQRKASGMVDYFIAKPFAPQALRERLIAVRRLVSLRRVCKSALDRVSEGVIIIDERGTLRSFNSAAERLFGWSAEDVIGQNVSLLMPPRHGHKHGRYIADYLRTGRARMVGIGRMETAQRRDGSQFPMQLTVADISDDTAVRFVGVVRDLSAELERLELQQLALHDALTGLPNRSQAEQRLRAEIERAGASGAPGFALLFVDLDRFKQVNDSLGHAVGDQLLCAIAQRLRHALSADDFVARLAGDEFLLLLPGVQQQGDAQRIAERVGRALRQPLLLGGQRLAVTASIGVALYGSDGRTAEALMGRSDAAMYAQKRRLLP
ncbi:diguanylate cyclase [Roseateles sp. DAIF2]|uniref:sensor domain-containing diguanylate cyclase n=1 Tax=Roseateles sp. DAIF2 TaxID=2714952 RepID=UPI0018A26255|nr:sensor domain-containing diguanylate cyclase [Roseateles sp. DAIF2]QPF72117.1 diguanylate cyclase [Roseateles sp. DAIF2]